RARPTRPRAGSLSLRALEALQRGDFETVERCLCNDFHEPMAARAPEIARTAEALRAAGASNAMLAGSGSCLFTLAATRERIEAIAARLELPDRYLRFVTAFAKTPQWRS
ncbi:MAG TPA: hypothetical protein VMH02_09625, partial [Verrucomicrobiae bacterium]|nr:hypothetical protein [Verrucomicrobiae bacterium]